MRAPLRGGRRTFFKGVNAVRRFLVVAAMLLSGAAAVQAQAPYPNKPIRVVIPFGPGGFADITMRLVGQKLSERTGQQVVIENRPSAGGVIAAAAVTSAAPDGYTLFVLSSGIALSKSLLKSMPFDPVTAFTPISNMALFDLLLLVKADSAMRTIDDALESARAPIRPHSTSAPSIPAARRTSPRSCCGPRPAFPSPSCRTAAPPRC